MDSQTTTDRALPSIPELGEENTHYGKLAHKAEKAGDLHARSVYKVAQYITLGKEAADWPEKLKYFRHALERHAKPRPPIDGPVFAFYEQLKDWVRREVAAEAFRLVRKEDEFYTERANQREPRFRIVSDAARFFREILGADDRPDWFTEADYRRLKQYQLKWA